MSKVIINKKKNGLKGHRIMGLLSAIGVTQTYCNKSGYYSWFDYSLVLSFNYISLDP